MNFSFFLLIGIFICREMKAASLSSNDITKISIKATIATILSTLTGESHSLNTNVKGEGSLSKKREGLDESEAEKWRKWQTHRHVRQPVRVLVLQARRRGCRAIHEVEEMNTGSFTFAFACLFSSRLLAMDCFIFQVPFLI